MKKTVYFYTKENCSLCDEALTLVQLFEKQCQLIVRDIYDNDEWLEKYQLEIPVVEINDQIIVGKDINIETLQKIIYLVGE